MQHASRAAGKCHSHAGPNQCQLGIDVHLAHGIDDHRDGEIVLIGNLVIQNGCLARVEKAGEHGHRQLLEGAILRRSQAVLGVENVITYFQSTHLGAAKHRTVNGTFASVAPIRNSRTVGYASSGPATPAPPPDPRTVESRGHHSTIIESRNTATGSTASAQGYSSNSDGTSIAGFARSIFSVSGEIVVRPPRDNSPLNFANASATSGVIVVRP